MRIYPKPEWGNPVQPAQNIDDAVENLNHVLALYADDEDDRHVIMATQNVYGDGVWTGLTMGDLRRIFVSLEQS